MGHQPIRSKEGLAFVALVRSLVEKFPEVVEAVDDFGHTSFRVRKKPFVILGERPDGLSCAVKSDPDSQDFLVRTGRFRVTPYIGRHGWVSFERVPPDDVGELEGLLCDGFRRVAPAAVRRRWEEGDP